MAQKEHPALAAVRKSGTGKVKVACSDIDGVLRGKYLHKDKFFGAAEPHPEACGCSCLPSPSSCGPGQTHLT